jgi:hypothetical protein
MFDVSFSKAGSFVSALQLSGEEMGIDLWAYNSADQLVGAWFSSGRRPAVAWGVL